LGVFRSIVDTRELLRDTLKATLNIDPGEVGLAADVMVQRRANLARIIDSWETARKRIPERDRSSAEQKASRLRITLEKGQHVMLRQIFEAEHGRLRDHAFPCHAMVERRMEEIDEGEPKAELLSEEMSVEEAFEDVVGAVINKEDTWRTKKATKSAAPPTTSKKLRSSLRLLRVSYTIAKYKHSTRQWLSSTSPTLWNDYCDWLLGDEIAGYKSLVEGTTIVPPWSVLMELEHQYPKEVIQLVLYHGKDIATAFFDAKNDAGLKLRYFSTPMAMHAALSSKKRGNDAMDDDEKMKMKREWEKKLWPENKKLKGRDAKGNGKGNKSKGDKKGGEKSKDGFRAKHKNSKAPDRNLICYSYQDDLCRGRCNFFHVCSECMGAHPRCKCKITGETAE
jgi:hypothetical protein